MYSFRQKLTNYYLKGSLLKQSIQKVPLYSLYFWCQNPVAAFLRKIGVTLSLYIDELITLDKVKEMCRQNVEQIVKILSSLGFVIHLNKCIFKPVQIIEYLGFIIDSLKMAVSLTTGYLEKSATLLVETNPFMLECY